MIGAILGDMIGSPYEFIKDGNGKTKEFPLFVERSSFTDDSVMSIALADALMEINDVTEEKVKKAVIESMQRWGRKYPNAGYGGNFYGWIFDPNPQPYGSWGNGSAMRVSPIGWLYDTLEQTREDFEDVIRTAVSLAGDCDTLTCIAGSIAEAFYGVPEELKKECRKRLTDEMVEVVERFEDNFEVYYE